MLCSGMLGGEDDDEFLLLCALLTTLGLHLGSGRGSIVSPVTDQNEFVLLTHTKSVNSTSRNKFVLY